MRTKAQGQSQKT